jgi:putative tricarboxylic transport membrane protein
MKNTFNQEHIIGIICISIGTVVLSLTRSFPGGTGAVNISGPAFFPNVLSIILIALGVLQILNGIFSKEEGMASAATIWKSMKSKEFVNLLIMSALFIFFNFAVERLGFFTTSGIFLILVLWRLGLSWVKNLIDTAVFLVVIYLAFGVIFKVTLPSGILF